MHRAELLRMNGPTDAAEAEALAACDELRSWMRREYGWLLTELGNIRLRRGDLDGAEEAFLAAHGHAWCPHPGLALVKLARGDVTSAAALIDESIRYPVKVPSKERPPFGELYLAPGGRTRTTGSDAEKARGSVGRCLRYALDQLGSDLPALSDHLDTSLRTGTYCSYRPDALVAVAWET